MDSKLKVSRAVTKLAFEVPFFGSCALTTGVVPNEGLPTAATDGKKIFYNPSYMDDKSEEEVRGIICHEVLHVIWQHCSQMKDKNPQLCNVAMDYVINNTIRRDMRDSGLALPEGCIWDEDGSFIGMTWQQVYAILEDIQEKQQQKEQQDQEDSDGDGQGGSGSSQDDPYDQEGEADRKGLSKDQQKKIGEQLSGVGEEDMHVSEQQLSEAEAEELKQDIERMVIKAAQDAESMGKPGSIPGSVKDLIKDIRESKVDWREVLWSTLQSNYPEDFSYRRPNKRYIDQGMYMPTMEGSRMGTLVIAMDTSGSVSRDELITYCSEVQEIIEQFRPSGVYLMSSDFEVANVLELEEGEDISEGLDVIGGGGTCFRPVFDHIEKEGIEVEQLIYFSDMYVCSYNFPDEEPDYDVIWVSSGANYEVPFGQLIMVNK